MSENPRDVNRLGVEVICSIERRTDGKMRLIVDVAEKGSEERELLTWRDFDEQDFLEAIVPERDLADLGLLVVARLAAACGGLRAPDQHH